MNPKKRIDIHVASDEEMNRAFVDAWHKAEKGGIKEPEEHLYFEDAATLLRVLSNKRLILLSTLLALGKTSIRALQKELKRDYKNVYRDVQELEKAGLIKKDSSKKIFVPWHKIHTEIDLAA